MPFGVQNNTVLYQLAPWGFFSDIGEQYILNAYFELDFTLNRVWFLNCVFGADVTQMESIVRMFQFSLLTSVAKENDSQMVTYDCRDLSKVDKCFHSNSRIFFVFCARISCHVPRQNHYHSVCSAFYCEQVDWNVCSVQFKHISNLTSLL